MARKAIVAQTDDDLESDAVVDPDAPAAEWLTTEQVAALVMMNKETIRRMVRRGEGPPCYDFSNMLRFRPEDVRKWIDSRRIQPRPVAEEAPVDAPAAAPAAAPARRSSRTKADA
ncbi:MAG: helix-turn-helix domain-containing protein [Pikeienuella sp.]|uniref:helix-turn-helix domain-containing protein n=1 Tax=Pikeienuella sp. TaxID=2831957 RepID=UPI00391D9489